MSTRKGLFVNDQTAQVTTNSSRKSPLLIAWVAVSAFIVVAAYLQTAGMLRLAVLTQLLSGYDVFAFKRFDVPRLPPAKNFEINGQKGGKLSAIAIQGKYAYVGAGESLLVLNIENPKRISIAGSLLLLGQITDIEMEGRLRVRVQRTWWAANCRHTHSGKTERSSVLWSHGCSKEGLRQTPLCVHRGRHGGLGSSRREKSNAPGSGLV